MILSLVASRSTSAGGSTFVLPRLHVVTDTGPARDPLPDVRAALAAGAS